MASLNSGVLVFLTEEKTQESINLPDVPRVWSSKKKWIVGAFSCDEPPGPLFDQTKLGAGSG